MSSRRCEPTPSELEYLIDFPDCPIDIDFELWGEIGGQALELADSQYITASQHLAHNSEVSHGDDFGPQPGHKAGTRTAQLEPRVSEQEELVRELAGEQSGIERCWEGLRQLWITVTRVLKKHLRINVNYYESAQA